MTIMKTRKTFIAMLGVVTASLVLYGFYARTSLPGQANFSIFSLASPSPVVHPGAAAPDTTGIAGSPVEDGNIGSWSFEGDNTATTQSDGLERNRTKGDSSYQSVSGLEVTSNGDSLHKRIYSTVDAAATADGFRFSSLSPRGISDPTLASSLSSASSSATQSVSIVTPTGPPTKVLCINFMGRLGNQLFQYASTLGLARRLNRIPVYGDSALLAASLKTPPPSRTPSLQKRCSDATVVREEGCCHFQKLFVELDPGKDFRVGPYMQSWKYFQGFEDEVKAALTFSDEARNYATSTVEKMRETYRNHVLVGVHVRRGDYTKASNTEMGYRTAPHSFFNVAFDYIRGRFGNATFLVSIDDKEWLRPNLTRADDVIFLQRQTPAKDMALLSSLDHVITTVGTYSWWVGFLSKGVVVYWKDFIDLKTSIGSSFWPNGTTFVYPGWIPL